MTPTRINWQGNPDFIGWYGPPDTSEEHPPSNRHPQHPIDSEAIIAASLNTTEEASWTRLTFR